MPAKSIRGEKTRICGTGFLPDDYRKLDEFCLDKGVSLYRFLQDAALEKLKREQREAA
jgi:hypothetical protein